MSRREVGTFLEGAARWVQASAASGGWITASAPVSALVGYVQVGMQVNSAREATTIMDRGNVGHHKRGAAQPIDITITYLEAVTANMPPVSTTAAGASVPLIHWEFKTDAPEMGAGSAIYCLVTHCFHVSRNKTEQAEGNQIQEQWRGLAMVWPTASGYIA